MRWFSTIIYPLAGTTGIVEYANYDDMKYAVFNFYDAS